MAIIITEEIINKADTYIPLARKAALAKFIAPTCVETVKINAQGDDNGTFPMPDMAKENKTNKSLFLTGILASLYLHLDYEHQQDSKGKSIDLLPTYEAYDDMAGSAIFNQLERMKQNKSVSQETKNKVFDLLYDYKDTQNTISAEIYGLVQIESDVPTRLMAMIAMQTTPEAYENMTSALESSAETMPAAIAEKRAELKNLTGHSEPLPKNIDRQKIVRDIKEKKRADKAAEQFIQTIEKKQKEKTGTKAGDSDG